MGKAKTAERLQAQDLYTNTSLTLKEVADMVRVSAAQLGKWAEADNWELLRTAKQNTSGNIISGWYAQLKALNDEVEENGGIPTPSQSDSMSKIADNIKKLSKKQDLSMYHAVLKEFLEDLMQISAANAKIFAPLMLDFMKRKAQKLKSDS